MEVSDKQVKKIKLDYHLVPAEPEEIERRLRQAYDVIFRRILENNKLTKNNYGK